MPTQLFISASKVPPSRWREAFPAADIVRVLPERLPADVVIWWHNAGRNELATLPAGVRCVALHDRPNDETGLQLMAAGAVGYANSHATPQVLQAIDGVVRAGGFWIGESLLNRLLQDVAAGRSPTPAESPCLDKLSGRERDVALRVVAGASNKEIARDLDLSERTVKAHLTAIFEKLEVRDRLQLALLLKR